MTWISGRNWAKALLLLPEYEGAVTWARSMWLSLAPTLARGTYTGATSGGAGSAAPARVASTAGNKDEGGRTPRLTTTAGGPGSSGGDGTTRRATAATSRSGGTTTKSRDTCRDPAANRDPFPPIAKARHRPLATLAWGAASFDLAGERKSPKVT
jgi:hypothetical protein